MHNSVTYDVAIAGGGLAGLCLAIQCANAGFSVALFEKENYPFHKVCGEYISLESLPFLQRLGFDPKEYNAPIIDKLQLTDVQGNIYEFHLPLGGFGISRYTLDNALCNLADSKGVHVLQHTKVSEISFSNNMHTVLATTGSYNAKVVAGSFGKRSNLDSKWKRTFMLNKASKLNNYVGVKYHVQYALAKNTIQLHNFSNGYCGISNVEDDHCCCCYLTTAKNLQQSGNSIQQMEKIILSQNPHLEKIFTTSVQLYKEPLAISQISFAKKEQVIDHVLLVGDAAGLITPLCGNGMSMAMHGSLLAFQQVKDFLNNKISREDLEKNYINNWKKTFSKRLATGRMVQRVFGNNHTTKFFLQTMKAMPWLANKIIQATHGKPF